MIKTVNVTMLPDGRMDRKNAAAYVGLAPKTMAQKACKGEGPRYTKRGRCWYEKKDLDDWIVNGDLRKAQVAG